MHFSLPVSDKEEERTDCIRSEGDLSSLKLKAGLMTQAGKQTCSTLVNTTTLGLSSAARDGKTFNAQQINQ
ncbi:hypothetical protein WN944_003875 [Citrus x changshan-huyou]|uniref:Uncharacterized protein n=1 Tax=Citrus x changshan-huyou TaxID=2935761 RepID=A0AAP0M034_9ROSI